jgi:hypothetical protein
VNSIARTALVFGTIVAALFVMAAYGRTRWVEATHTLQGQLEAARLPAANARFDARELEGLPAPVQRYFRAVLKDGQPVVTSVTVRHTGTFNVTALGSRALWMPFTSEQRVVTRRPGFVWNARMALVPGIAVLVHDAYAAGVGTLHPAVMGLFSLTHQHGTGDVARGELMRFMLESAWYPTALLPSQGVVWAAVDEVSADATMVDGDIRMTMRFRFDAAGLIESVRADARGAMVGSKVVMMPWEGRMSNYQKRDGMLVPLEGEAAWVPQGGRKPYWRGTIVSMTYEFAGLQASKSAATATTMMLQNQQLG